MAGRVSATDHLSRPQFFHGSQYRVEPGDTIRRDALYEQDPRNGRSSHDWSTTRIAQNAPPGIVSGVDGVIFATA
jgi:hypothetical protein